MSRLNSVIRRYTPPTCTLEIWAESSPLSRWMGQTVLKQIRFELHFDDPGLPDDRKVPIQGDRDQLEVLCNVVTTYVQQLLQKSADSFCLSFLEPQHSNTTPDEPQLNDVPLTPSSPKTVNSSSMGILEATIYLESSGNLTHKLFLGSLANSTSGPVIQLTLLQLFDLATALDEYSADVIALPNLNSESSVPSFVWPAWTPVAAMMVLALGLTPLTWQYANSTRQTQEQTAKTTTSDAEVAIAPSPSINLTTPQPELAPLGNLPSPPPSSTSLQIPNPDSIPPLPNSIADPAPLSFPNSTIPSTAKTLPKNGLTREQTTKPALSANLQIPLPKTPYSQPNFSTGGINQSGITLPTREILPTRNSSSISTIPQSLTSIPNDSQSQTYPQISSPQITSPIDSQQVNSGINSPETAPSVTSNADVVAKLRNVTKTPLPTEGTSNTTLFDIPQVAEAREFLQKTWQPPSGFSQTLEYSLMLGIDGSIERILPLNRAAREYVNTTGIPEIGKAFVSTNKSGQNVRLRVVLSPDGKVQTFPETP